MGTIKPLAMFSIIFFIFVAIVFVIAFFALTWRKKNKVPLENDEPAERYPDGSFQRSSSAFSEPSTDNIKGGIVPTDSKPSQSGFDDENDVIK